MFSQPLFWVIPILSLIIVFIVLTLVTRNRLTTVVGSTITFVFSMVISAVILRLFP